jgi:hypothetical protein
MPADIEIFNRPRELTRRKTLTADGPAVAKAMAGKLQIYANKDKSTAKWTRLRKAYGAAGNE